MQRQRTYVYKQIFQHSREILLAVLLMFAMSVGAQTPVANRVKAAVASLPKSCQVVAKYTDNQRHCLYYIANSRLYRYDVMTNKKREVKFSTEAYLRIAKTFLTENGTYLFICADKKNVGKPSPENVQELWRINSFSNKSKKIAEGFDIEKEAERFTVKTIVKRVDVLSHDGKTQWKAQDRYFHLDGQSMTASEEYTVK